MEHFDNYIDGKWTKSNSKKTFKNISPSNIKECLGVFPMSNKIDIDNAVTAAKKAFEQWKATPAPVRGKIIFKIGQIMSKRKKELANIISKENGKTIAGGLGDVQSGIDMAYFVGGEGRRWYGRTTHSNLPKRFAMALLVFSILPPLDYDSIPNICGYRQWHINPSIPLMWWVPTG